MHVFINDGMSAHVFLHLFKCGTTSFGTETLLLNDLMILGSRAFSRLFLGFKTFEGCVCVWECVCLCG